MKRYVIASACVLLLAIFSSAGKKVSLPFPQRTCKLLSGKVAEPIRSQWMELMAARMNLVNEAADIRKAKSSPVTPERAEEIMDWQGRFIKKAEVYRQSVARYQADLRKAEKKHEEEQAGRKLATLRKQVDDLQNAFQRLNKSIRLDGKQREEWEKTTEKAVNDAIAMGSDVILDLLIGIPEGRLNKMYDNMEKEATKQIQRTIDLRINARKVGDKRLVGLLGAAQNQLINQRKEIHKMKSLMKRFNEARTAHDLDNWALSDSADYKKLQSGMKQLLGLSADPIDTHLAEKFGLKSPVMKTLGKSINLYGHGKRVVRVYYGVTAECISWTRLNQLNRNNDEYLKAVDALDQRMKALVARIDEIKASQQEQEDK